MLADDWILGGDTYVLHEGVEVPSWTPKLSEPLISHNIRSIIRVFVIDDRGESACLRLPYLGRERSPQIDWPCIF